jgi:molybdate transport system regulatory protein
MNDRLQPRIRISLGSSTAIGLGKAALLEAIGETGSIAAAGRRMGMSYRRAWLLSKMMNACFREPLIEAAKGGIGGDSVHLSSTGREVVTLYCAMEDHAAAVMSDMEKLRALMVDEPPEDSHQYPPICAKYHIGRYHLM